MREVFSFGSYSDYARILESGAVTMFEISRLRADTFVAWVKSEWPTRDCWHLFTVGELAYVFVD